MEADKGVFIRFIATVEIAYGLRNTETIVCTVACADHLEDSVHKTGSVTLGSTRKPEVLEELGGEDSVKIRRMNLVMKTLQHWEMGHIDVVHLEFVGEDECLKW
jgi:hypothetical protein